MSALNIKQWLGQAAHMCEQKETDIAGWLRSNADVPGFRRTLLDTITETMMEVIESEEEEAENDLENAYRPFLTDCVLFGFLSVISQADRVWGDHDKEKTNE